MAAMHKADTSDAEFARLQKLIYRVAGISLADRELPLADQLAESALVRPVDASHA
jgi:hypothetical protein